MNARARPRGLFVASRAVALALALVATGSVLACGGAQRSGASSAASATPTAATAFPRVADDERRPEETPARATTPLRVVEQRNEQSPLVTFRVVFEAGSADDPAGREGLTNTLAGVMSEGGTEELTYEELTRRLFPMAARITSHTDRDTTVFVGQVHRDHAARFYPLFRDVVLRPRLADEDFRRVRSRATVALTQELRGNDDELLGKEVLQSVLYEGHPYGHPPLGTERGLSALTRDDLVAHRTRVFCRERLVLGLSGGYDVALAEQARRDFDAAPSGPSCARAALAAAPSRPSGPRLTVVDKPSAGSVAVSIGFPLAITRADADFAALQFVTNYLGLHRQSSGVLYRTLREVRGLNYGDYAYAEWFEQDGYERFPRTNIVRRQQFASVWLRPVRPNTAHFAVRAAVRAISELLTHGLPPADFERTRTFLNGYLGLYAQTENARLGYAIDDILVGAPAGTTYADRLRAAWSTLTPEGALEVARRHLTASDLHIVLVAPDARTLADAIVRDAPSPITYDTPRPPNVIAEDHAIEAYPLRVTAANARVLPLAETFR